MLPVGPQGCHTVHTRCGALALALIGVVAKNFIRLHIRARRSSRFLAADGKPSASAIIHLM